ncbi:methyltransferase [Shewanella sp. D64]|uniref:tRNA1(Val) (adenine(37)-N6)-methyltransferase n=1 Tax=unclassified Shewanella TaxID=196818 RepID=UPI0022BA6B9F|nr:MULTISPECIES: methyltransferase [unclassified Shewanella]MEC4728204.1 methyltransferase [Shewanella sp. D64]MEC4740001.1 methyltransferase [Shewanella sp. E94]WBJ94357.1 methyltransferase [Shewanella sp. MTB7]
MAFTFKQFHIDDHGCGMPVSTDAVLLGAWAPMTQAKHILDIGAGSGLLSLMAMQRSNAHLTAIELDDTAVRACEKNFSTSKWLSRLDLVHASVQDFSLTHQASNAVKFDHIICNPPYFKGGTQSSNRLRAQARHTDTLDFRSLLQAIAQLLTSTGTASLILPTQSMSPFNEELLRSPLWMNQITDIRDSEQKSPHRHLFTLKHRDADSEQDLSLIKADFCIKERDGSYTQEMIALITDFYLKY